MKVKEVILGVVFGLCLVMSSCEEEEIEDIESVLPNDEVEGDARDRFEGTWTVTETGKLLGVRNFVVNVSKDDEFRDRVNISNFYLIGNSDTIIATVSSILVSTITIQDQTVNSTKYSGLGDMENDQKINFDYFVDDGNDNKDTISAVFVR